MKFSGNVLGMKRVKTDEFDNMFAHSCLGMPLIFPQIGPYFVRKYDVLKISWI